ncbi:MAG: helicase-exonuclease AddAB subunit AddB, partial [Lachnospiraceae bacterium]|nr:helicase-exonuclease AddAB subunit AddB [Lachnospiraceae bacterium]
MGLQFCFGAAGAGKSRRLHQDIIDWSLREPERSFLLVVPDQFTMYTQMELVKHHPRRGLLNIDVVSFGRMAHRIFAEVGGDHLKVLDDTGKSLVLRKLAANLKKELPVIGKGLAKPGYIAEVKSAISEFMQYGIGPVQLQELVTFSAGRGVLLAKLTDLQRLYQEFLTSINERFMTTEETLDRMRMVLPQSGWVRDSVVVFDGFTGFTPLQYRVIGEMMG